MMNHQKVCISLHNIKYIHEISSEVQISLKTKKKKVDLQTEHFNFHLGISKQAIPGMGWAWIIVRFCIITITIRPLNITQ